jgi:hypothetical protein
VAYARFTACGSDAYVYEDVRGFLCCMRCGLSEQGETRLGSRSQMIAHLEAHRRAGQKVPEDAIEELRGELAQLGDLVTK